MSVSVCASVCAIEYRPHLIQCINILVKYRALLVKYRALLIEFRALLLESRAFRGVHRALWMECWALFAKRALYFWISWNLDFLMEIRLFWWNLRHRVDRKS